MKNFMKLLSLLLCFELIIGPLNLSLITPQLAEAQTQTCPTGQTFNNELNRCLTSADVVRVNNATQSCGQDKECYKNNAKAELDKSVNADELEKKDGLFKDSEGRLKNGVQVANAAAISIPLFFLIKTMVNSAKAKKASPDFRCRPASLMLMFGGAAALGAGEIITHFTHKSNLKKMQDRWNDIVVPKYDAGTDDKRAQATEAQSQAFEFLAQNEDSVAKVAKTKKGFYGAATGLFAAGSLMAGWEIIQLAVAKKVPPVLPDGAPNPAYPEAVNKIQRLTCGTQISKEDNQAHKDFTEADKKLKEAEARNIKAKEEANKPGASPDACKEEENAQKAYDAAKKDRDSKLDTWKKNQETKNSKNKSSFHQFIIQDLKKSIELSKAKLIAAQNISSAKNVGDLLELIQEFESIEFENYSKTSYFEEDHEKFKKIKIDSQATGIISNIMLTDSHHNSTSMSSFFSNLMIQEAHAVLGGVGSGDVSRIDDLDLPVEEPANTGSVDSKKPEDAAPKEKSNEENKGGLFSMAGIMSGLMAKIQKTFKLVNGKPIPMDQLNTIAGEMESKFNKFIYSPVTRLGFNALLGTWMGIMTKHMSDQQKISEARAAKLREMKTEFESANGLLFCKSEDRSDPGKPKCYCFTADNKPNPARSNSKICQTSLAELNYKNNTDITKLKTCVDENFHSDPKCACKSKKSSTGGNSCLKTTSGINFKGFNPGMFKMLSAGAGPGNDILNGNMAGGSMDEAAMSSNAAKIRAAANELVTKADPSALKQAEKMMTGMQNSLIAGTSGMTMGGTSALPTNPKEAVKALEEEVKKDDTPEVTKTGGSGESGPVSSPVEEQPEFGLTEEQMAAQESEIAEVMGQEMDMGNNDINSGEKTNLFDVLSNRYKRSGMRRLFDEDGKTKADAPSNSDIAP